MSRTSLLKTARPLALTLLACRCAWGACPNESPPKQVRTEAYNYSDRTTRPLTLPRGLFAFSIAGRVDSTAIPTLPAPVNQVSEIASVSYGLTCDLELSLRTLHRAIPLVPIAGATVEARYQVIERVSALSLSSRVPVPELPGSTYTVGLTIGLPSRIVLSPSTAFVGLDEFATLGRAADYTERQSEFPYSYSRVQVPVGALFQFGARAAAVVRIVPVVWASDNRPSARRSAFLPRMTAESSLELSPVNELDVSLGISWTRHFEIPGNTLGAALSVTFRR